MTTTTTRGATTGTPVPAEPSASDAVGATLEVVRARTAEAGVPAVQVAVVQDRRVVVADAWGDRVVGAGGAGPRTLFHHGSCGKAWFSLAVAAAGSRGELSLDEPVRTWLPELRLPDPVVADRVTLRDLLSHRSGLGRHDLVWILDPSWGTEGLLARLRQLPMSGDLRSSMTYSNLGYGLAALVYERATGRPWSAGVEADAIAPLGGVRATPERSAFLRDDDRATPHVRRDGRAVATHQRDLGAVAAAGGVALDAGAAADWLLHQLDDGAAVGATHHVAVGMDPALAPLPGLRLIGYALGWVVATLDGRLLWWHSGNVDGFFTHVALLPDAGAGASVSVNLQDPTVTMPAAFALVRAAAGTGAGWWPGVPEDAAAPEEPAAPGVDARDEAGAPARGGAPHAHALETYVGSYVDAGYGRLEIAVADGDMTATLGPSSLPAEHRGYETWVLRYEPLEVELTATFETGPSGAVDEVRLVVDAETTVVFRRREEPAP